MTANWAWRGCPCSEPEERTFSYTRTPRVAIGYLTLDDVVALRRLHVSSPGARDAGVVSHARAAVQCHVGRLASL